MKACQYEDAHRRHQFSDGSVLELCPADETCDSRLQRQRRGVLCPGFSFRPDPTPRDPRPLRAGLLASLVAEPEEQEQDENEKRTGIDIVAENTVTDKQTLDEGADSETDPEEPDSEYDSGSDEDESLHESQ